MRVGTQVRTLFRYRLLIQSLVGRELKARYRGPILLLCLILCGRLAPSALLLPLPILVQLILTVGLALIISALTVHFRDLQNILGHLVHLWFFASPVLYYYGARTGKARLFLRLNPM